MTQTPENQQQYGSILTILGENAEQNGKLQNKQITFTHMAIGDANDEYVQPDRKQTALVNELARIPVNSVDVLQPTPDSVPMLKVEAILPDDVNDLVIREFAAVATFDGNTYFHAVGNNARIYVPPPVNNGNVSTPVTLEMIFVITSAEPIVEIDPNVVTASRDYVNGNVKKMQEEVANVAIWPADPRHNAQIGDVIAYPVTALRIEGQLLSVDKTIPAGSQISTINVDGNIITAGGVQYKLGGTLDLSEVAVPGGVRRKMSEHLEDKVNIKNVGPIGDEVNGDKTTLEKAIQRCKDTGKTLYLAADDELHLFEKTEIRLIGVDFQGKVVLHFNDEVGLEVGGTASSRNNPPQNFTSVVYHESVDWDSSIRPTHATVRGLGVKGQELRVWHTPRFELYARTNSPIESERKRDYSCAYSRIFLGYVKYFGFNAITTNDGGYAWINENDIYLTSCSNFVCWSSHADGGTPYAHNHNRIHGGTFEGKGQNGVNIDLHHSNSNHFINVRLESAEGLSFGPTARSNQVICSWYSSGKVGPVDFVKNDDGENNLFRMIQQAGFSSETILSVTKNDLNQGIDGLANLTEASGKLKTNPWEYVYESTYLPIRSPEDSDSVALIAEMHGLEESDGGMRVYIKAYDEQLNEITGSSDADFLWVGGNSLSWGDAQSSHGANVNRAFGWPTRSGIRKASYIKVLIRNGGNISTFDRLSLQMQVPKAFFDSINLPPANQRRSRNEYFVKPLLTSTVIQPYEANRKSFELPGVADLSVVGWMATISKDPSYTVPGLIHEVEITGPNRIDVLTTNLSATQQTILSGTRPRVHLRHVSDTAIN